MFNDKHLTFVQMIKLVATAVSCGELPIQASVISYHLLMDQPSPEHLVQNTSISVYQNKESCIINHKNGLFFTEFHQLYHIRKCQNVRIINHWKKYLFLLGKTNYNNNPIWYKNYFIILFLIVSFLDGLYYYGFKFANLFFNHVLSYVYPTHYIFISDTVVFNSRSPILVFLIFTCFYLPFWTQNTV